MFANLFRGSRRCFDRLRIKHMQLKLDALAAQVASATATLSKFSDTQANLEFQLQQARDAAFAATAAAEQAKKDLEQANADAVAAQQTIDALTAQLAAAQPASAPADPTPAPTDTTTPAP
jgi:chromosome segregation ATPase